VRLLLPRDQFLGRNVCTSEPAWYGAGGPVPARISRGRGTAQAAPRADPTPVSSPVSGDVDTAGVHNLCSKGLRDAPSTPPRGKAASVTSPPLAAPRVERDAAPRSSPEARLPPIFVGGSPAGAVMWTRTIRWGSFCFHLVAPTRRALRPGISWGRPPEVPELRELVDAGAAAAADTVVFPAQAGTDPQIWEDWFT